ncbi:AcrR family transcriptional regulator [Nocardia sp. GAS34]
MMQPTRARPSREQRREEVRAALLDATIQSLVVNGYAATTTRGVAELAGLSQGAQQHHFRSKADLVKAATIRLADLFAETFRSDLPTDGAEHDRVMRLVDLMWTGVNLPTNWAMLEFIGAARTDPEIAEAVADLARHLDTVLYGMVAEIAPAVATAPAVRDWLRISLASMCSVVALGAVPGCESLTPSWDYLRTSILSELDRLTSGPANRPPSRL